MFPEWRRKQHRPTTSAWASWCLAGWMLICTASYLYVMTADRLERVLLPDAPQQVADIPEEEGP